MDRAILLVAAMRYIPQIDQPIVCPIPVDVIDFLDRPPAMGKQPDDAVGIVMLPCHPDLKVSIELHVSRNCVFLDAITRRLAPSQDAKLVHGQPRDQKGI
uniref:Uncharacterized protein n=1 Tax=viral metagenome TaxID=1070528 RepID=A0A6M3LP47_9ZZZZ